MDVYFERYPDLTLGALAGFVDGCESSDLGACEIREVTDGENEQGLRVGAFTASQGSMRIGALVHSVPSPASDMIRQESLSEEVKNQLLSHRAFALLTLLGGDDLRPVERTLFLYKMVTGLCMQDGIGVGVFWTRNVFPGGLLTDFLGERLPDAEGTVWNSLRSNGEPPQLLVRTCSVELSGRRFLATCGHGHCGLDDLLWQYTNQQDAEQVTQMFKNCFNYMMRNGPVIKAGHTIGYDSAVAFRFEDCPEGLELPYPVGRVLLVKKASSG
jgi:hypothetical protein